MNMNKLTISKHALKSYKYILLWKSSANIASSPIRYHCPLVTLVLPKACIAKIPLNLNRVTMGVKFYVV